MISDTDKVILPSMKEFDRIFDAQKKSQYFLARTNAKERIAKLNRLRQAIAVSFNEEIKTAVYQDLRKNKSEVELNEIFPVIGAIKHTSRHLKNWMRNDSIPTPLNMFGFSHKVKFEPKGRVLIVSPWNFPVNLSFIPLVSAIAAGNAVIIKPSEVSANTSRVMAKIIASIFDENEVSVVLGGVKETTHILTKPFNHIFFTGAPQIGKIVMAAAAKNLTSVCLELGGKSPTIIDQSADINKAASRVAWAKCLNNGQVCIAPDHVFIHESVVDNFVTSFEKSVKEMYGNDPQKSESYGRIINGRHFLRLQDHLEDAIAKGGKIESGGNVNIEDQYISPTMISGLDNDASLWQEEIFGPILPIRTFRNIEEVIDQVNEGHKPLALYVYSKNQKNINLVVNETRSGAVGINYSGMHTVNPDLPFGGSNNSGIGKANGIYGFKSFSNEKAIQKHWAPFDILRNFYPPYTESKYKLVNLLSKWLA